MKIGKLHTGIIEMRDGDREVEGGYFEVDLEIDDLELTHSKNCPSPWAAVINYITQVLFMAIADTGVGKDYWIVEWHPEAKTAFNIKEDTMKVSP